MLIILTGGQTGVDLGAARAALDLGVPIAGFMPSNGRNEDGPIPQDVAMHLTRHASANPAARTRANVATAAAALVIVPNQHRAGGTRGTALTIRLCERQWWNLGDRRLLVVDPTWLDQTVVDWALARIAANRKLGRSTLKLLVAGPRRSLWADGEREAARFVRAVLEVARG